MSKTKKLLKKVKKMFQSKKHWKQRDLKVLERFVKRQKKKPLTIKQYFFGTTDAMETAIARKRHFKKSK